jgi:ClpP class serine protease
MGRDERREIIEKIEGLRGSRVLAYVTGDRAPIAAQIGDDAVRPIYDHLREMGHVERLDLFLYSRGGAIDIPWRKVTALRAVAGEWNALIPFRANSAATLLALGADKIVMGPQGELGPIDPIMNIQRVVSGPGGGEGTFVQESINVEDVMAYIKFVKDRAGLSDQAALAGSLTKLTERLDAVVLGSAHRTHSHIRDVARRMLLSRKEPPSEQAMAAVVETLAERVYAHGHAIGRKEADEIGLPVEAAQGELDASLWDLLRAYEV